MRGTRTWLAGLIGLGFTALAGAHAPLPDVQWCASGRVVPVATFQFTPAQVQAYADCLRSGACVVDLPPSSTARGSSGCDVQHCGQFDDDYGAARRLANTQCRAYVRPWAPGHVADRGSVVEVVSAPAVYNGDTHHEDYHACFGLAGQCGRCEDPPLIAVPVETRRN